MTTPFKDNIQFCAWALENPVEALKYSGITPELQEGLELDLHVIDEDPRYPLLCVNGALLFGMEYVDGQIIKRCLCGGGNDCFCDLD